MPELMSLSLSFHLFYLDVMFEEKKAIAIEQIN